jgi:hypothetical protein
MLGQGRHPFKLSSGERQPVAGHHGIPPISCAVLIDAKAGLDHGRGREFVARRKLMANAKGPNIKKKQKCKNCEGKGLLKKGDKVVKCQRCGGTGFR